MQNPGLAGQNCRRKLVPYRGSLTQRQSSSCETGKERNRQDWLLPTHLALVEELVVQDGSSQAHAFGISVRFLCPDDASLAEHGAVLLAGDFFRHLENHFH